MRHHSRDGGGGVAARDEELLVCELSVPRLEFVAVLKRRLQRARRFRTLPLALAFLALYIAAMMSRSGLTSDARDFDRACVARARARRRALPLSPLPSPHAPNGSFFFPPCRLPASC